MTSGSRRHQVHDTALRDRIGVAASHSRDGLAAWSQPARLEGRRALRAQL
jgi:hypothetical protein